MKVLVVEDDKFLRTLISKKLASEGYEVVEAIDGEEGLKKFQEEAPGLVLLDLILPGMNGFDVLTAVRQDPGLRNTPIIVLSNLGQKDDIEKAQALGAKDYLIKAHFTPQEIVEKINKIIDA